MMEWPDKAIIYGMFFQHKTQLRSKWRDRDRKTALNIKSKTASQTMQIARTGKLSK